MIGPQSKRMAAGFTILEITLALGILIVAMVLVTQVGLQSMHDRARNAARHQAEEVAANVLELARACSWDTLTPEWAVARHLPAGATESLANGQLKVQVTPEANRPHVKRVTVTISWTQDGGKPARPVELVGLYSERSATTKGGQP